MTGDQLETQVREKGTLGGHMEQLFITVTKGTNARARYGTHLVALDALDTILSEPLKRQLPEVALAIGIGSGLHWNMQS